MKLRRNALGPAVELQNRQAQATSEPFQSRGYGKQYR